MQVRSLVSPLQVLQRLTIEIYEVLSFESPILNKKMVTEWPVTKLDYLAGASVPDRTDKSISSLERGTWGVNLSTRNYSHTLQYARVRVKKNRTLGGSGKHH